MVKWIVSIIIVLVLWSQFDPLKKPIELIMFVIALAMMLRFYPTIKEQLYGVTHMSEQVKAKGAGAGYGGGGGGGW